MKRILGMLLLLTLVWACSSDNSPTVDPPEESKPDVEEVSFARGPMLINWADNIIIPSYESFSEEMSGLTASFETFKTDASTTNLVAFREAWLSAYKSWQHVALFEIGPAEIADLRFSMNTYPTDTAKIEEHMASGTYDLTLSSNRDAKGFPALDYLINGLEVGDQEIVSKYNGADKDALIAYVETVLTDMKIRSDQVLATWKDSYRATFIANDGASATASVDRFVNDYIFYFEKFLRAGKMGIPLGVFSGSPLPEKVEAVYKGDISKTLFLEGLQAVQDFFNGTHFSSSVSGESLASYLDALNSVKDGEDLKAAINDQLNASREMVGALNTFRDEIENNSPPTNMLLAYDEVQRIVPLLKVDMVSAMSISIDFVDADGD
ncbi:peptidase M75 [Aggregatimonas sangjinii]|uniref:Peptidase M75 n=1 Tax=Aggregatimonas sangjinii TaxID=2583587 RepID=A0A5B7SQ31_9FLAO|nr:imelysin family protein [Aggregatimonas sangjinii]QCX00795.1 peptidase M75 [Aggregatimonas sangjinii]